jgi:hypothetical protein
MFLIFKLEKEIKKYGDEKLEKTKADFFNSCQKYETSEEICIL